MSLWIEDRFDVPGQVADGPVCLSAVWFGGRAAGVAAVDEALALDRAGGRAGEPLADVAVGEHEPPGEEEVLGLVPHA